MNNREMDEFDFQPVLAGQLLRLRPLIDRDFEEMYSVAADPKIWELNPEPNRYERPVFEKFFAKALESNGALTAVDLKTGQIIGSSRFHTLDAEKSQVFIGFSFLSCAYWGGHYNGEMKRLMIEHAFKYVGAVLFRIGERNLRSLRAIEKIGARLVGRESTPTIGGQIHIVYRLERDAYQ